MAEAKRRVLLADDDKVLAHLLSSRLRALGWHVQIAQDAMQAVMFTKQSPPDVIILDISMPGGTGAQVLKTIKASTKTQDIPVIVLSGTIDPADEARMLELGATTFIRKPVEPDALVERMQAVLG